MPRYFKDGALVGADFDVDLAGGTNISLTATEDAANRIARYTITAASGAGDVLVTGLDKTGATDIIPALQAAHTANPSASLVVDGAGSPTYSAQTPFFLAESAASANTQATIIDGKGATIVASTMLPTITTFTPDTSVKGIFFPNTKTSAYSAGVVRATTANQAMGAGGKTKPKLILRNFTFDFTGLDPAHSGIAMFANGCGTAMEYCRFIGQRAGLSWNDYSDRQSLIECSAVSPLSIGSYGIYQFQGQNGDSLYMQNPHGRGCSLYGWSTNSCNVIGGIGNQHYVRLADVKFQEIHWENDQSGSAAAALEIVSSHVLVEGGQINPPHSGSSWNGAIVLTDDTAAGSYSDVRISDIEWKHHFRGETDPQFKACLYIAAINGDTRIRWQGNTSFLGDVASSWKCGPIIQSGVAGVTSALAAGWGQLAGDWELWQRRGTWVITPVGRGPVQSRKKDRPTGIAVSATTEETGTLTNGTVYNYQAAIYDEHGNLSQKATVSIGGIAAGASKAIKISLQLTDQGTVILWRSHGATSVDTNPEFWVRLVSQPGGATSPDAAFYDLGANVNGVAWNAWVLGDPVPDTHAAADHTVCKLRLDDGTITP
jgi:hypothetical protein